VALASSSSCCRRFLSCHRLPLSDSHPCSNYVLMHLILRYPVECEFFHLLSSLHDPAVPPKLHFTFRQPFSLDLIYFALVDGGSPCDFVKALVCFAITLISPLLCCALWRTHPEFSVCLILFVLLIYALQPHLFPPPSLRHHLNLS